RFHVEDGRGLGVAQFYQVFVVSNAPNHPPDITSTPPFVATVGEVYRYSVTATDPDNDPPHFVLLAGPQNMSIDPGRGLLKFTRPRGGTGQVALGGAAPWGGGGGKSYPLRGLARTRPPSIPSAPAGTATVGQTYRYDVRATDPDGEALSYSLVGAPT